MEKKSLSSNSMADRTEEFEALYQTNQLMIYRFMFWRTRDEMLAEDLTSSVFMKAWRTLGTFQGGSARVWLHRIARTTLIDYWRKRKEVSDDGVMIDQVVADTQDPSEALDERLAIDRLKLAVARLPRDMRDVVERRFVESYSARETAAKLGLSEANVRVIQYRALKKLREYLR